MGQKRCYFEKQSGEVAENKGKGYMNSQKQTGKQSGEIVENTCLWKKLSQNKPENKAGHVIENTRAPKSEMLVSAWISG